MIGFIAMSTSGRVMCINILRHRWSALVLSFCFILAGCGVSATPSAPELSAVPVKTATAGAQLPPSPTATATALTQLYNQYTVNLDIKPSTGAVTGTETLNLVNTTGVSLTDIYFHVYLNAFSKSTKCQPVFHEFMDKVYANGSSYGYMSVNNITMDGEPASFTLDDTILHISLPTPLAPNDDTELKLELEAQVPEINERTGMNGNAMWFGNFLPLLAVYDSDGWHLDPYYPAGDPFFSTSANFTVTITTPPDYTVAGSGTSTVLDQADKRSTTFTAKLTRDFAFALSDRYNVYSTETPSGVDIDFYTYSNVGNHDQILKLASDSLEYYSKHISAYPYNQLAIVEAGLFNRGGMEYPEVVFIDSSYLSSSSDDESISHEIAHQWFYNVIGNNEIDNAWMDEGLATFMQKRFLLNDAELSDEMEAEYRNLSPKIAGIKAGALSNSLADYSDWSDYYNVQYLRAMLMFYSLYERMGSTAFDAFLKEYYKRYSFQVATPNGLIQTAEDVSGLNLGTFFNNWINDPQLPDLYK
jgi:hypothetical protein